MNDHELQTLVAERCASFYQQRIQRLEKVMLKDFLGHRRADILHAMDSTADKIVTDALSAYLDSLDGGLWSDAFFEPIAKAMSPGNNTDQPVKAFWERLDSHPGLYIKLIRYMKAEVSSKHRIEYDIAWCKAVNRCLHEFLVDYYQRSGKPRWELLVRFNSG